MHLPHPDLEHPRRHRRSFARFAMWFSDWQGTPPFVAMLTVGWIGELLLNQLVLPALGIRPFDPSTWLLNLTLSLLAAYAASLAVMGTKVVFGRLFERLDATDAALRELREIVESGNASMAELAAALRVKPAPKPRARRKPGE